MEPRVSFITAVKDRLPEFEEMLQSLIKQDISEWEAIIVDDHSIEPIDEGVKKFNEPRFHYYKLPVDQKGISCARNLAIEKAKSNIMIIADSDDIDEPTRARITYETMNTENCDVFYGGVRGLIAGKKGNDQRIQPFSKELLPMFNFITNPCAAFRRDKFLKIGKYDPNFVVCEDFDLYLRFLNNNSKFCYTEKILLNYRHGTKNVTKGKKSLFHKFFQLARIKNNIQPFDIEDVKKYALPEFTNQILSKKGRSLWQDDRFIKK